MDVERGTGVGRRLLVADVVVLDAVLQLVRPQDVGELDGVDRVPVVLVRDEPHAPPVGGYGVDLQGLDAERGVVVAVRAPGELEQVAQIAIVVAVDRRRFLEHAGMPRHLRLHEEFWREDRAPLDRLVVGTEADLALTASGGKIGELRRIVALGAVASRGGIAEEGEIDLLAGRRLPGELQRVVVGPARSLEIARGGREREAIGGIGRAPEPRRQPLVEHRHSGLGRRESGVLEAVGAPAVDGGHRIEGEEVEQLVLLDRPAHREGEIVDILGQGVGGAGREIDPCIGGAPAAGRGVPSDAPLEVVGPRLDDGVDDPAEGLPVLRFETAGLDLDLVQELAGHPGPQGTVDDVVRADPPEPGVGDVHAVDQVGVLQAGRAADRIVALTGAESAHHTRRDGVGIGERSPQRHRVREIVVFQACSGGGRGGVD